jgi:protein-S-isoprenylcysteine O-methyltransferase Ste14
MQNELQNKVVQWIESSAQAIGGFATKEIPPFIHEYLQWKFVETLSKGGVCFTLACIMSFFLYKGIRKLYTWFTSDECECDAGVVFVGVGVIIGLLANIQLFTYSCTNLLDSLQIKLAPKVYLIEKAAELIK